MAQGNQGRPAQPPFGGFIFVHIPKTGGSSVTEALQSHVWSTGHNTMLYVKDKWPDRYESFSHTFSMVRNPWARMVAFYHMSMWPSPAYLDRRTFVGPGQERKDRFNLWLNRGMPNQIGKGLKNAQTMLCDKQGRLLVDAVYDFKTVQQTIDNYRALFGEPPRPTHANRREHPARGPYQSYYIDSARDLVAQWGAWEIERFGYTF